MTILWPFFEKEKRPLEKIKFFFGGKEIIPILFLKFGHTSGLTNLILNYYRKRIWFRGNTAQTNLHFEHQKRCFFTDNNEERAIKTRKKLLMIYIDQIL